MSDKLDELFGGEQGFALRESRIKWVRGLLAVGLPMVTLGVAGCAGYPYFVLTWLSVPGAGLVLWAWLMADADLARVESGHLGFELGPDLERYRKWALIALIASAIGFIVQMKFLVDGTYEAWLTELLASQDS